MSSVGQAVEVVNLSKRFPDGTVAVKDLTLGVPRGQILALLGPNGSGKTTTINLLTTSFAPTSGGGRILGYDITKEKEGIRHRISLVPQYETIDWSLTVEQNLRVFAGLLNIADPESRLTGLLKEMQLEDERKEPIEELSGGQIRRVQLARGMLFDADLIFVDEPTIGLDPVGVHRVLAFLRRQRDEGKTIILASNVMEEVQEVCDRVVFLHKGSVVYDGPPEDLVSRCGLEETVVVHTRGEPNPALISELEASGLSILGLDPLHVSGDDAARTTVELLAPFISTGYQVEGFVVNRPTLKDAFLKISGATEEEADFGD